MSPVLALILANVIWGAAAPIFKLTFHSVPPFVFGFLRFFISSVLIIPLVKKSDLGPISYRTAFLLTLGSLAFVFHIAFFFLGLQYAPSINVSIISTASPIFLYFLSIVLLKEPSKPKLLGGMLIGSVGVLVIILSPVIIDGARLASGEFYGNLLYVLSVLMDLVYMLIFKRLLERLSVATVMGVSFFITAALFLPLAMVETASWQISSITSFGVFGILFGALFCSLLAYYLFYWGIKAIPAEEMGLYTYIDPVITVLVAIPLLQEYPDIYFLLGSLLIFGGIFMAEGRLHWHPLHKLRSTKYEVRSTNKHT